MRGAEEEQRPQQRQEEAHHHPGAERGGGGPGALALPLQHRPVPRREAYHLCTGRRWVELLGFQRFSTFDVMRAALPDCTTYQDTP